MRSWGRALTFLTLQMHRPADRIDLCSTIDTEHQVATARPETVPVLNAAQPSTCSAPNVVLAAGVAACRQVVFVDFSAALALTE